MLEVRRRWAIDCTLVVVVLGGCSGQSVKTHPVVGKVEIKDGDVGIITGSYVELQRDGGDDTVRPGGNIEPGGAFTVKTIHEGNVLAGAPEGKYKVRITLADETDEGIPKRKGDPFHKRYLNFQTSGLSLTIPSGEYKVSLSKK